MPGIGRHARHLSDLSEVFSDGKFVDELRKFAAEKEFDAVKEKMPPLFQFLMQMGHDRLQDTCIEGRLTPASIEYVNDLP
jgi:hypothetical protein